MRTVLNIVHQLHKNNLDVLMDKPESVNDLMIHLIEAMSSANIVKDDDLREDLMLLVNYVMRLNERCMKNPKNRNILLFPILTSCTSERDVEQRMALNVLKTAIKRNFEYLSYGDYPPMISVFDNICRGDADFETATLTMEVVLQIIQGELEIANNSDAISQHFVRENFKKICDLIIATIEHYAEQATSTYFSDLCCRCIDGVRRIVSSREILEHFVPYVLDNIESDDVGDCTASVCLLRGISTLVDDTNCPQLYTIIVPKLTLLCTSSYFDDRETAFEAHIYITRMLRPDISHTQEQVDNSILFLCRCLMSALAGTRQAEYLRSVCSVVKAAVELFSTEAFYLRTGVTITGHFYSLIFALFEASRITDSIHEMPDRACAAMTSIFDHVMRMDQHRNMVDVLVSGLLTRAENVPSPQEATIMNIVNVLLQRLREPSLLVYGDRVMNILLKEREQGQKHNLKLLNSFCTTLQTHLSSYLTKLNPVIAAYINDPDHEFIEKVAFLATLVRNITPSMIHDHPRMPAILWENYLKNDRPNVLHEIIDIALNYGMVDSTRVATFMQEIRTRLDNGGTRPGSDEDCMKAYLEIVLHVDPAITITYRDIMLGDIKKVQRRNLEVIPVAQRLIEYVEQFVS
jgi:hypothetical protein